jgi:DNA-binding transcriptional LysR family regulator
MEMQQVRYFLAMARTLNFTHAATDCGVTQPSLTRAIQKLEDELGGPLFRRERSRTHLTELGRLMLPHFERTFEAAQTAKALAKGIRTAQVAPLALGVAKSLECGGLDGVLAEIADALPGFELTVVSGRTAELIELALGGDLDLVIVEAPGEAPDRLEAWELSSDLYHMIARADHPLASSIGICLQDVKDEYWIDSGDEGPDRLRAAAAVAGFEPAFRHRADNAGHVRRLIRAGLGSAFMPPTREDDQLVALRFVDISISRRVLLAAIAGRRRSVAMDAFMRAARSRQWSIN